MIDHWLSRRSEDVDLEKDFEQNELNSAVYLISMAMQISNFAVNYKVNKKNHTHWVHCQSVLVLVSA